MKANERYRKGEKATDRDDNLEVQRVLRLLRVQDTLELRGRQLLAVLLKETLRSSGTQKVNGTFPRQTMLCSSDRKRSKQKLQIKAVFQKVHRFHIQFRRCLLYTSDAADDC